MDLGIIKFGEKNSTFIKLMNDHPNYNITISIGSKKLSQPEKGHGPNTSQITKPEKDKSV